jgi:gamma-glutamyltranspeptidase
MLLIRTLLVCLALTFTVCGCSRHPTDEEFARIAHDFISTKYSWADKATYEVKKDSKNWTVTVHPPTPTPEGNTVLFIEIDRKGKVVSFQ